jgi:hypothetical protein
MYKLIVALLAIIICPQSISAEPRATLVYGKAGNTHDAGIRASLLESRIADDTVAFINDSFKLGKPLKFLFGADDGPGFDPQTFEILMPYDFVDEVQFRFESANYDKTGVSANQATMDAIVHTLFHELAHALIAMYDLPVLGKEEDAADSLAVVLLIEYFENGAETAISAADLFGLESEDRDVLENPDFWDTHSLDLQRYYATMCQVYGSDPETYASLPRETELDEERADRCIDEYANLYRSWFKLLKPHLKKAAQLPQES